MDVTRPNNTGRAKAAGDHGGVAGHAAPHRQDAGRGVHAANVFRAGFDADQD
ncbi:MAG: hypothetical protein AAF317_20780 [Pseudomonadota bacterium]